jgi:hypothetical protein
MSSSTRDRFAQEILDTLPVIRVFAAACLMLRRQRTDHSPDAELSPTQEEVAQFIERLDLRGLRKLRWIALKLEDETVH